jgi:hypothetical protein
MQPRDLASLSIPFVYCRSSFCTERVTMSDSSLASKASIMGHPIHPMLVPFPIACFSGALVTDIAYWRTANMMWSNFSAWLIFAGLAACDRQRARHADFLL